MTGRGDLLSKGTGYGTALGTGAHKKLDVPTWKNVRQQRCKAGEADGPMVDVRMPFEELILFPLDKGPPLKALK